jgi:RNA polymerase sigma-70 factor (ECF subfamily)
VTELDRCSARPPLAAPVAAPVAEPVAAPSAVPLAVAADFGQRLAEENAALQRYVDAVTKSRDEASEVCQEALARAWRSRASFESDGSLRGWLRQIALRTLFDLRRRRAAQPQALGAEDQAIAGREEAVETRVARREELERLLAPLSEDERRALIGFHGHGRSLAELAGELGRPVGTIKSLLHRARQRLQDRQQQGG